MKKRVLLVYAGRLLWPWESRRTSLSCHIGSLHEAMVERHKAGLENIARHCRGERPLWIVNPG